MQNRVVAVVLAMVAIVPLVAAPLNASIIGSSAYAFQALGIALFAMALWKARFDWSAARAGSFLKTGANLPILAFAGVLAAGYLLSPSKEFSGQELLRVGAGIALYFAIAYNFRRSEHFSKLVDVILAVGIVASIAGFALFSSEDNSRATGLFGNAQTLSSVLMMLLPVAAVVAITEKGMNRQLAAQVATVMMAACLLLTQTRSSWLGAAVGFVVLGSLTLLAASRNRKPGFAAKKHEVVLPVMLLVAAIGFFVIAWPNTAAFFQRATTLANASSQKTFQMRQSEWNQSLSMFKSNPWTGVGPGMVAYYRGEGLQPGQIRSAIYAPSFGDMTHNFWLQTAAETGIPGVLFMGAIVIAFLAGGVRRVLNMDAGIRRSLLMASIAGITGFCVDSFSNPSWQLSQASMFLWLVLGMGVAAMRPQPKHREEVTLAPAMPAFLRPAVALASLGLVALLPTASLAGGDAYPKHIEIRPRESTIKRGGQQAYSVVLYLGNGEDRDVTLSQNTTYAENGKGKMVGPNKHIYQAEPTGQETVVVTATWAKDIYTLADSAVLNVVK